MPAALKIGEENKDWGFKINYPFYVVSKKGRGYFLDLLGDNMVMKTRNGMKSQQWYFDQKTRSIKSVRTPSKSWDIQGSGKGTNLNIYTTNSGWWQLWKWDGKDSFYNVQNKKVLDSGSEDKEATNVQAGKKNGTKGQ